jgi:hypothetical protein
MFKKRDFEGDPKLEGDFGNRKVHLARNEQEPISDANI